MSRSSHRAQALLLVTVLHGLVACGPEPAPAPASLNHWEELEPGLHLGTFELSPGSLLRVLRADAERFKLRLLNASATSDKQSHSARDWCRDAGCVGAINASMYQTDALTAVSLMRSAHHVNNGHTTRDMTVLAFDRNDPAVPPVMLIDRECDDLELLRNRYGTLIQSIRMISCKGENVWQQQPRQWSTAAVGLDGQGRVLLMHARAQYSVHDLIELLRALPLDLASAMYVEGGPEAQLFVSSGDREEEYVGSYELSLREDDDNRRAWPVPNVIAVFRSDPFGQ